MLQDVHPYIDIVAGEITATDQPNLLGQQVHLREGKADQDASGNTYTLIRVLPDGPVIIAADRGRRGETRRYEPLTRERPG